LAGLLSSSQLLLNNQVKYREIKKLNIFTVFITSIIFFSFLLRLYKLDQLPVGLNVDEASNGYDAFSLGYNGRDQHGNLLPIMFKSFHDWVSPLLTYLTVPFVKIFGLSVWSVRLPVALLGSLSVVLTFLNLKKLGVKPVWQVFGTLLIGLGGWHILVSRWAIPPSAVPFFSTLLLWSIFSLVENENSQGFRQQITRMLLTTISALLLIYAYPTQKVFVPLFFTFSSALLWIVRPQLRRSLVVGFLAFVLGALPLLLPSALHPEIYNKRYAQSSIFDDRYPIVTFVTEYFDYFSPGFLFFEGDRSTIHQVDGVPTFTVALLLPLVAGAFLVIQQGVFFIRKRNNDDVKTLFLLLLGGWILISPIPAALTDDPRHTLRVIHLFPSLILLITVGAEYLVTVLKELTTRKVLKVTIAVLFISHLLHFTQFLIQYNTAYRYTTTLSFNGGLEKEVLAVVNNNACKKITLDVGINQPYIYYLFFTKYLPSATLYEELQDRTDYGYVQTTTKIGNVLFQPLDSDNERKKDYADVTAFRNLYTVNLKEDGSCSIDKS
jgi:uncharacterized membrane protein